MQTAPAKPAILIVVENLPVPLDRRVWQEAQALRDAGYGVSVICPRMRGYTAAYECLDGIHIHRHWISGEAGRLGGYLLEYVSALWGEARLAWNVWRRRRFRVVHICNPPDLICLAIWPFKWLGVKVIYDVHDCCPEMFAEKFGGTSGLRRWVRWAERLTYRCADVVLATNESVKRIALTRGGKQDEEVFVVRTAPDFDGRAVKADPALKNGRTFLVGFIGVMGNTDGVQYLLEAVRVLIQDRGRQDIQFRLMGTGPEYTALKARRDEAGLTAYVDMPGRVSNEELFTALQTMDLGVACDPINAYNDHCTMNKTLEYMAFGKAQVMFGIREGRASAGAAARYVEENSAAQLATAIAELLDDPNARARMGAIGRQRLATELNWEQSVAQLQAAYAKALSG